MEKTQHIIRPPHYNLHDKGGVSSLSTGQSIEELKKKDYSALSSALQRKGELRLLYGDISGLHYFDMASKLDPSNPDLLCQQGLSLFEYGSEEGKEKELSLASKRFKIATSLSPTHFEAWHAWGNTLYLLGVRKGEKSYFIHAKKKYEKAIELSQGKPYDILADLYWDYGTIWAELARQSGEVDDFHTALKGFEQATTYQDDLPSEFWLHFGHICMNIGERVSDLRFFLKAINCYKNSISITISSPEGWFHLGCALHALYSYTHDEDHFSQASECFATATQLHGAEPNMWLHWASLLLEGGEIFKDNQKLHSCIEKCRRAHHLDKKNLRIIGIWAEALSLLGIINERLDFLHEAQNKMEILAETVEANPDICYSHGRCLMAFGIYFKDTDFFYQAIEKLQEGVSINRTHYKLWFAMAMASFSAAMIDQDDKSFERAHRFFERALNLNKTSLTHHMFGVFLSIYGELLDDQKMIELAIYHMEQAFSMQKNAAYLHPDWLFQYASALDILGEFVENEGHYIKSIDILHHVLMVNPEFPKIHYQIALTYTHYGELINDPEIFFRAIHHYRIAHQRAKEDDKIILDWALTLIMIAELLEYHPESDQYFREAEYKMIQAARLGNVHAYYSLACLYSLQGDTSNAMRFLEKALNFNGLPSLEELLEDDWLDNIRELEAFQTFLSRAESIIK
jgi:tetratricopeptide (TPR) repeat protein